VALDGNRRAALARPAGGGWAYVILDYSTVTDLAKFLGWSTSQPRRTAM